MSLPFSNNIYPWIIGIVAIIILLVVMMVLGRYNFKKQVQRETSRIVNQCVFSTDKVFAESDITDLPAPVQKWLFHSGMVRKPFIYIGKVTQLAEMKLKPEQQNWLSATALQYTTIVKPGFIWTVDVKMNGLLNFQGRDRFEDGKGSMLIKLNSVINVVNEVGEKLNEGTIQRYLGEMAWFPSLALSPYITWEQISDSSAVATMEYMGTKGSGTFYFSEEGDFTKYVALRYKENVPTSKRYEWVLLVNDYDTFEGIRVPSKMTATWKLEEGDWTWLRLEVTEIKYNESVCP